MIYNLTVDDMQGDALMIYTASAVMIYNLTVDDIQSQATDSKTLKMSIFSVLQPQGRGF
jgi:hypothetical protein